MADAMMAISLALLVYIAVQVRYLKRAWNGDTGRHFFTGTQDWVKDGQIYTIEERGETPEEVQIRLVERGVEMSNKGYHEWSEADG